MATLVLDPESADPRLIHLNKPSMLIGKAADADVSLQDDSLADHHARIDKKEDGYYIINLQNGSDIFVNGESVTFQKLKHGDRLNVGDVSAVVMLEEESSPEYETPMPEKPSPEMMPVARGAAFSLQSTTQPCPQCGFAVSANMMMCPQCGQALSNNAIMQPGFIPPTPMNLAGPGILPVIAFLAALSVIGAPVALVLGLITLSVIRRHGGTVRDHRMAKWSIGLGLFWVMVGLLAAGGLVQKAQERKQLDTQEVYEAKVIRALKNLACAQKYAHTIEFYDADSDGHGEYGNLPALAEMSSPFFDSDLADGEAYGYRFTIREVSEGRFLAVAEPIRYKGTGIRTFAIDQSGQIRGGDAAGKRFAQIGAPLPALQGSENAFYEIDDEIAKDVLNYTKSLSSTLEDQEKTQRILARLRSEYSLTTVGRELEGMKATVDRFVSEQRAQMIYLEAQAALAEESQDVALAKLMEIWDEHPSFSKIAAVERELIDLRSAIEQQREVEAQDLFAKAEELERSGERPKEVQRLFQRIEKLYPDTEVAARIETLKPELQRQLRERNAEEIFSELMELSPENEFEKILSQANQLQRNYSDTDLFGKIEAELTKKERSARASSWRSKTRQNIEAGRMRGALAQLESAMRENPDLQYDLRDLCVQLYRDVAGKMMEEGDARGALGYYTKLDRLLQSSGAEEQVSRELLAELNRDVGMANYEREDYAQARWHLVNAAWQYKDNAQFNMRLGAASLYSGLYRPAEAALTQALVVRPDMEPALLYRAYLNMKVALALERVVANGLQQGSALEYNDNSNNPSGVIPESNTERSQVNVIIDENDNTYEEASSSDEDEEPEKLKTIRSRTRNASVASGFFAPLSDGAGVTNSPMPEPTDIDLVIHYSYDVSRNILPDLLVFLQDVQSATGDFAEELKGLHPNDLDSVKLGQLMLISEYRNQLGDLRATHLQDLAAQKKLFSAIEEMKRRVDAATFDIQTASAKQPRIQTLAKHILPKIKTKRTYLFKSSELLAGSMEKENDMRQRVYKLAEDLLKRASSGRSRDVSSTVKSLLKRTDGISEIDQALLLLRDSMEINAGLEDILRAAEGRAE